MYHSMYMNDRGQLTKSVFSFHCGVLRDQIQVVSLGDKLLLPRSYLFSPRLPFIDETAQSVRLPQVKAGQNLVSCPAALGAQ